MEWVQDHHAQIRFDCRRSFHFLSLSLKEPVSLFSACPRLVLPLLLPLFVASWSCNVHLHKVTTVSHPSSPFPPRNWLWGMTFPSSSSASSCSLIIFFFVLSSFLAFVSSCPPPCSCWWRALKHRSLQLCICIIIRQHLLSISIYD